MDISYLDGIFWFFAVVLFMFIIYYVYIVISTLVSTRPIMKQITKATSECSSKKRMLVLRLTLGEELTVSEQEIILPHLKDGCEKCWEINKHVGFLVYNVIGEVNTYTPYLRDYEDIVSVLESKFLPAKEPLGQEQIMEIIDNFHSSKS